MNDDRKLFTMPKDGKGNGTTEEIVVANWEDKTLQVGEATGGAFAATVTVEGRVEESMPWHALDSFTVAKIVRYDQALQAVRLVISNYSSGVLVAAIGGFNVQG